MSFFANKRFHRVVKVSALEEPLDAKIFLNQTVKTLNIYKFIIVIY